MQITEDIIALKERQNRVNAVIIRRAKNRNLIELDIFSRRVFNLILKIVKINKYLKDRYSLTNSKELEKKRQFEYNRTIEMKQCLDEIFRNITDKEVKRISILMYTTQNKEALKLLKGYFERHQKAYLFNSYFTNAREFSEEFKN